MQRSKSKRSNKKYSKRNRRKGTTRVDHLTTISNQPIQTRCIRYIGTIASSATFLYSSLFASMVSTISSSTDAHSLLESVRLRRVGVTCLPASATNAGSFSFVWKGDREPHTTDTAIYLPGVPFKKNYYPPEGSFASFWLNQDSTGGDDPIIFILDPDNTTVKVVLDMDFEYVVVSGPSMLISLASAASFSGIGYPALPRSSLEFIPVGLDVV